MNHNEEVPDFLGGLGDMLPADVLKKVIELLEQLRRADKDHQGSTVFIYAPGSQYVETVQTSIYPPPPAPPLIGVGRVRWEGSTPLIGVGRARWESPALTSLTP